MTRKKIIAVALVFSTCSAWIRWKRKRDLIFHGQLRLLNSILIALTDRFLLLPLRRIFRYFSLCTGIGNPRPGYLLDLQDLKGKEFLEKVLRDNNYLSPSDGLSTVSVTPFSAGQMSRSARLDLQYTLSLSKSAGTHPPPPTVIVKMTRQDIMGKVLNMLVGLYRECACYSTLLPSTGCPVPGCLFSDVDEFSKDFLLVLSDGSYLGPDVGYVRSTTVGALSLADDITVDALKAPGVNVYDHVPSTEKYGTHLNVKNIPRVINMMKRACQELCKMHIKYWNDPALFEMDLSLSNRDSLAEAYAAVIASWKTTKKRARTGRYEGTSPWRGAKDLDAFESLVERSLMAAMLQWGKRVHADPSTWRLIDEESYKQDIVADAGFTLLHGDFHSENVFVRELGEVSSSPSCSSSSSSSPEFLILDWQLPSVGDPVKDVARMIVFGALDNLCRETYEMDILRAWWEIFTDYSTHGNRLITKFHYPWELAVLSYKYWAAHHAALLIMTCEISKFFDEDNASGYRSTVDKFVEIVKQHGDPTENFQKRAELIESMGRRTV